MKLEVFTKIMESIQAQGEKCIKASELGIDLLDYEDHWIIATTLLFNAYYGSKGWDWIAWYLFERTAVSDKPLEAFDGDKKICYDIPSLWKHVEELRVSVDFVEFDLPKTPKITDDDLFRLFPSIR